MSLIQKMNQKANFKDFQTKDKQLDKTLTVKDFLSLGLGTILSTSIFTLPGIVAAQYAGPAVVISFILAAIVAGLVATNYAEMASALPFAGSAYSWISVLFGKFWGWIVGWALLAEYIIAVPFVAAGLSSNVQGLLGSFGLKLPSYLANPLGVNGGIVDILAVIVVCIVAFILFRGDENTSKLTNVLVLAKLIAIIVFIVVGATAIKVNNYVPFIPHPHVNADGTTFGGWGGIYAGVSTIFLSYIGFDSIASNSAEAKNPQKTMPRGIIGSLIIGTIFFICVSLVLVGMFKYTNYANNAEPVGWALRNQGHPIVAFVVQLVAVLGMLAALIAMTMAGSRLIYSFGRDHMLPKRIAKLNRFKVPSVALWIITIVGVIMGGIFPFTFLAQLISTGTLIAFMFASLAMYPLRRREGKDLPQAAFKAPFYPVFPALGFIGSLLVFWGLDWQAKSYAFVWFIIGAIIYFTYGMKHSNDGKKTTK